MSTYTYDVGTDFAHEVEITDFTNELAAAGIPVINVHRDNGTLYVVTDAEKSAVDSVVSGHAGPGSLTYAKRSKIKEIDARTDALIAKGFTYQGKQFSLSLTAQSKMMGLNQVRSEPEVQYPIRWNTKEDDSVVVLANADAVRGFYLTAVGTYRYHVDSGTDLKDLVRSASTIEDLNSIVDDR